MDISNSWLALALECECDTTYVACSIFDLGCLQLLLSPNGQVAASPDLGGQCSTEYSAELQILKD